MTVMENNPYFTQDSSPKLLVDGEGHSVAHNWFSGSIVM